MVFFYRNYPYAPKATMISAFSNLGGYVAAIVAIFLIVQGVQGRLILILPALILVALAAFLIVYVGHKLTDKLAEPETEKNIATKPRFAMLYCQTNPDEYDRIAQLNPEFGQKYEKNEKNKIVKRKNA